MESFQDIPTWSVFAVFGFIASIYAAKKSKPWFAKFTLPALNSAIFLMVGIMSIGFSIGDFVAETELLPTQVAWTTLFGGIGLLVLSVANISRE